MRLLYVTASYIKVGVLEVKRFRLGSQEERNFKTPDKSCL